MSKMIAVASNCCAFNWTAIRYVVGSVCKRVNINLSLGIITI